MNQAELILCNRNTRVFGRVQKSGLILVDDDFHVKIGRFLVYAVEGCGFQCSELEHAYDESIILIMPAKVLKYVCFIVPKGSKMVQRVFREKFEAVHFLSFNGFLEVF